MDNASESLQEPLLPPKPKPSRDTFWPCAMNLSKVITGAGMMAIPRAYLQIGWLPGTLMLVGVAFLTFFTLAVLVEGSAVTHAHTYGQLTLMTCGRGMMRLLQLAVLMFCFGFSVVYLVVIRDILLGTPPDCNGLLCEALGPGAIIDARILILAVALLVCAPLLLLRSMEKLSSLNVLGVAATILLAASAAVLAGVAALRGSAHTIPMLPQWDLLGPTRGQQLEALTDVMPVILACYVAHQSLHPLMPMLQPYSRVRMCKVIAVAISIAGGVFLVLSIGAALTFGQATDINVLNNFSVEGLQPLIGWDLAVALSWAIRGGYLLCILATLLLYVHPLRSCLAEMIWPDNAIAGPAPAAATAAGNAGGPQAAGDGFVAFVASGDLARGVNSIDAVPPGTAVTAAAAAVAAGKTAGAVAAAASPEAETANPIDSSPGDLESANAAGAAEAAVHSGLGAGTPNTTAITAAAADGGFDEVQRVGSFQPGGPQPCGAPRWQQMESDHYYVLTYGLLGAMVLAAVLVTNIYEAVSAVGDVASTMQAFVVPGAIALALSLRKHLKQQSSSSKATPTPLQACLDVEAACKDAAAGPVSAASNSSLQAATWMSGLFAACGGVVLVLGVALFLNGVGQRVDNFFFP